MIANDEKIDTGTRLPRIRKVEASDGHSIIVTWSEGDRCAMGAERINLLPAIFSFKIYRPLRNNVALFQSVHIIDDGYAIGWDFPDLEMSADLIEDLAAQIMSPQDLRDFLARNNLTQERLAAIFDYSRRQIGYYLSGKNKIPRSFFYACRGYEAQNSIIAPVEVHYKIPDMPALPKPKVNAA